uniref:uncharacterized protein LOC120342341 n=1 Tax=Styela clava TaxID=7725 RepID=UPI00193986A9|nr:uncharacterized protein LOC120342341 [Styela clava]
MNMKLDISRRQSSGGGSTGANTGSGSLGGKGSLACCNMTQYRFTGGEVKTVQLGIAVLLFSIVLLAVLSSTMLLPALQSQKLVTTQCTVIRSELKRIFIEGERNDPKRCAREGYFCLQVIVVYKTAKRQNENVHVDAKNNFKLNRTSQKFENLIATRKLQYPQTGNFIENVGIRPETRTKVYTAQAIRAVLRLNELQFSKRGEVCTIQPSCLPDPSVDFRRINSLQHSIGRPGLNFPCHYDSRNFADVILTKKFDKWTIFHCLFWPGVFFGLGILIIFTVYCCIGRFKSAIGAPDKNAFGSLGNYSSARKKPSQQSSVKRPGAPKNLGMSKFAYK